MLTSYTNKDCDQNQEADSGAVITRDMMWIPQVFPLMCSFVLSQDLAGVPTVGFGGGLSSAFFSLYSSALSLLVLLILMTGTDYFIDSPPSLGLCHLFSWLEWDCAFLTMPQKCYVFSRGSYPWNYWILIVIKETTGQVESLSIHPLPFTPYQLGGHLSGGSFAVVLVFVTKSFAPVEASGSGSSWWSTSLSPAGRQMSCYCPIPVRFHMVSCEPLMGREMSAFLLI